MAEASTRMGLCSHDIGYNLWTYMRMVERERKMRGSRIVPSFPYLNGDKECQSGKRRARSSQREARPPRPFPISRGSLRLRGARRQKSEAPGNSPRPPRHATNKTSIVGASWVKKSDDIRRRHRRKTAPRSNCGSLEISCGSAKKKADRSMSFVFSPPR